MTPAEELWTETFSGLWREPPFGDGNSDGANTPSDHGFIVSSWEKVAATLTREPPECVIIILLESREFSAHLLHNVKVQLASLCCLLFNSVKEVLC